MSLRHNYLALSRTYTQIHTSETILPSEESFVLLGNKMSYILWVVALLEACDVTNIVAILPAILDYTTN